MKVGDGDQIMFETLMQLPERKSFTLLKKISKLLSKQERNSVWNIKYSGSDMVLLRISEESHNKVIELLDEYEAGYSVRGIWQFTYWGTS